MAGGFVKEHLGHGAGIGKAIAGIKQLAVARHGLARHGDRPQQFSGSVGAPVEMKGEMLVEHGAVDQKSIEAVGHQGDRDAFGPATPTAVNGAG